MKIGIISDTHDDIENYHKAITFLKKEKVEAIIHCGDFCAPFMMDEFAKLKIPFHAVFGNIDDRYTTTKKAIEHNILLHGDLAEFTLDKKKIAVNHFPHIAESLALSGKYDFVCYGHTHKRDKQLINKTLLINPGELMGRFGVLSCAVYDTKTNSVEVTVLE